VLGNLIDELAPARAGEAGELAVEALR